jgi:acetoin utilization deacetylase AcuC-like enzyme
MRKILIVGTEDSLFDNCLDLADTNRFNILYASDVDIAMRLIKLFTPDIIFCSAGIDQINHENIPVVQLTSLDISQFLS